MIQVTARKLGISATATPAANDKALTNAVNSLDDGSVIRFTTSFYPFDEGVLCLRGKLSFVGNRKSLLTYNSQSGSGSVIRIGDVSAPPSVPIANVSVQGLMFKDLNPTPLPDRGHNPAAVDALWVEDFLCEYCSFENVKGNSCLNVLGLMQNNVTPISQRCTIRYCDCNGDVQGDGINAQGMYELTLVGNTTDGGLRRHFLECGAGVHLLTVDSNRANMQGKGKCCLASFTVVERGTVTRNQFTDWGAEYSAIEVNPDRPELPVNNLTVSGNELASTYSGLAAIALNDGALNNHRYVRNTFRCILPFSVDKRPVDPFVIDDNDHYPDQDGRAFVVPADTKFTGTNRTHARAA